MESITHTDRVNKVFSAYNQWWLSFGRERKALNDHHVIDDMIASIFAPGPYMYAIFDWSDKSFDLVSDSTHELFGIKSEDFDVSKLLSLYHPNDMEPYIEKEKTASKFLFEQIDKADITNYKVSHCYRLKCADDNYRLFLSQSIAILLDENHGLCKTFAVLSDISFITQVNNGHISLIGMNGRKSYYNINPKEGLKTTSHGFNVSDREIEVIRLVAQGFSSKMIADVLNISAETVRTHRNNVLKKTGFGTTAEIIAKFVKEGLI